MAQATPVSGRLHRLGVLMEPEPGNAWEAEGVTNPAVARGLDGRLYLLPRLVGDGNYSRIGLARVLHDRRGYPAGVERLGVVLEPEAPYECNPWMGGAVEDPRVTSMPARRLFVMTYTAVGPGGPRIAAALSRDLVRWRRLGLVRFAAGGGLDMAARDNKDALLFPEPVPAPDGRPALALIHRPVFYGVGRASSPVPEGCPARPSMWLSYAPLEQIVARRHVVFGQHHLLAGPEQGWERLRVGGGAPPIRVPGGWLVLYHGVSGRIAERVGQRQEVRYSAGALLLDARDPRRVLYRRARSLLAPRLPAECVGTVPRVVFPTGIDTPGDGILDVYYGMADRRIGVARTCLAHVLGDAAFARAA